MAYAKYFFKYLKVCVSAFRLLINLECISVCVYIEEAVSFCFIIAKYFNYTEKHKRFIFCM